MQLVGESVKHKAFGFGQITNFSENIVTVCFSGGNKKFLYPDAFAEFLTLTNQAIQKQIGAIWDLRMQKEEEKKKSILKEQDRRRRIRSLKITPNSQAAFNLKSDEIDEVFLSSAVSTGCYLGGYSKGTPRIPSRLKPNSALLLTTCPKNGLEEERRIVGVFMAKDDFLGKCCSNGLIESHDVYQVRLSPEHSLRYWDYFEHSNPIPAWGGVAFKYFSNRTMHRMLGDMKKLLRGSEKEEIIGKFYHYFCEINSLPEAKNEE